LTALVDTVHAKNGDDGRAGSGTHLKGQAKRAKPEKPESKRSSLVPSHMLVTDISRVKQATHLFKDLVFCILVHSHICWFLREFSECTGVQGQMSVTLTSGESIQIFN